MQRSDPGTRRRPNTGGTPAATAATLVRALEAHADPARRDHAAGYFPSALRVLGVPTAEQRAALRPLVRSHARAPASRVLAVARALVDTGILEARQMGYELLASRLDVVRELDGKRLEALGRGNDNWASVDGFATHLAGVAWREGRVRDSDVLGWAASPDKWWRRTALASTVALNVRARGGRGDARRTLLVCERLAADHDPMVAKALSWALRVLVAVDREAVESFLARHEHQLAALVRREVRNKLRTGLKNPRRR